MFVILPVLVTTPIPENFDLGDSTELPDNFEMLEFQDRWVNLSLVESFKANLEHGSEGETKVLLSNGKTLQIGMNLNNFMVMLDVAGLIPEVTTSKSYGS